MSEDNYEKLREHLDSLPCGMPKTESGVEKKILQELFAPEEAELALNLTTAPESVGQIADRAGRDKEYVSTILMNMVSKGVIWWEGEKDDRRYSILSVYPGIFELQVNRMSKQLAQNLTEYLNTALTPEAIGTLENPLVRIIPVHKEISADPCVLSYEKVATVIENTEIISLQDCLCRTRAEEIGEACEAPKKNCLIFGTFAKMMIENGTGESISKEKAMEVLDESARAGLIHCTFNTIKDQFYICNCCGCCCTQIRSITKLNFPSKIIKSNYTVAIDPEECNGCGICVDRCHLIAVSLEDEKSMINYDRCIGCGVCIATCPTNARSLVRKKPEEIEAPFESGEVAYSELAKEKGKIAGKGTPTARSRKGSPGKTGD